jgi:hypothetical protein
MPEVVPELLSADRAIQRCSPDEDCGERRAPVQYNQINLSFFHSFKLRTPLCQANEPRHHGAHSTGCPFRSQGTHSGPRVVHSVPGCPFNRVLIQGPRVSIQSPGAQPGTHSGLRVPIQVPGCPFRSQDIHSVPGCPFNRVLIQVPGVPMQVLSDAHSGPRDTQPGPRDAHSGPRMSIQVPGCPFSPRVPIQPSAHSGPTGAHAGPKGCSFSPRLPIQPVAYSGPRVSIQSPGVHFRSPGAYLGPRGPHSPQNVPILGRSPLGLARVPFGAGSGTGDRLHRC